MRKPKDLTAPDEKQINHSRRAILRKAINEGGIWSSDPTIHRNKLEALTRRGYLIWRMRERDDRVFAFYTITKAGIAVVEEADLAERVKARKQERQRMRKQKQPTFRSETVKKTVPVLKGPSTSCHAEEAVIGQPESIVPVEESQSSGEPSDP